jgi:hypothetical protein
MTAQYRVSERCFLQAADAGSPREYAIGEILLFSGTPNPRWIPLNEEAVSALAAEAAASALPTGPRRAGKFDAWPSG